MFCCDVPRRKDKGTGLTCAVAMVPRHVVLDQAGADRMITTVQNRVFHSIAVVLHKVKH
jgi:hypothetical protein